MKNLLWIEDHLPPDIHSVPKHGGMGYFLGMNLVLILVEHAERVCEHKGKKYDFDLWKGAIFPVEQKKQNAFFLKYLFLENHPANKNWLYIPLESENFEDEVKQMLREISKRNPLLGIATKFDGPVEKKKAPTKKSGRKPKADKKRENAFILAMAGSKKK